MSYPSSASSSSLLLWWGERAKMRLVLKMRGSSKVSQVFLAITLSIFSSLLVPEVFSSVGSLGNLKFECMEDKMDHQGGSSRDQHYQLLPTGEEASPRHTTFASSDQESRRPNLSSSYAGYTPLRRTGEYFRPHRYRTRFQLVVCALIGVTLIVISIEGIVFVVRNRKENALDYEHNKPPPLIVHCPSTSLSRAETNRRTPSEDLLRWQRPWRDDAFCSLHQPPPKSLGFDLVSFPEMGTSATYGHLEVNRADDAQAKVETAAAALHPVQPVTSIPAYCLDSYMALGHPCPCIPSDVNPLDSPATPQKSIDVLWAWVNGSDPLHVQQLDATRRLYGLPASNAKLYRDHDELKFSLRSVLHNMRGITNRFRILAADMPLPASPPTLSHTSSSRLGQLPSWLTTTDRDPMSSGTHSALDIDTPNHIWTDGNISLSMRYHSQAFTPGLLSSPTFNSFSIESQLGNQCNVSENFVYMNDDFFITKNVEASDFYSPYYGPVIRFDYGLHIYPHDPSSRPPDGEWRPLERSSYMLSLRFGYRGRPYTAHAPKLLSSPLVHEMSAGIWKRFFDETAARPFRGLNPNPLEEAKETGWDSGEARFNGDDVHTGYIFGNFVVERWREALLWTWTVGRIGGRGTPESWTPTSSSDEGYTDYEDEFDEEDKDDYYDDDETLWRKSSRRFNQEGRDTDTDDVWADELHGRRAWYELGGNSTMDEIEITLKLRNSLDMRLVDHNLGRNSSERLGTAYTFSSLDGYPFAFSDPHKPGSPPALTPNPMLWQRWWFADRFTGARAASARPYNVSCFIIRDICFPSDLSSASDVFRHIAFEKTECGDCIIQALVYSSGLLGLSSFLPGEDRFFRSATSMDHVSSPSELPPPHLSLHDDYRYAKFSLTSSLKLWAEASTNPIGINVREWAMQLLQRYRFVVGDTRFQFHMLTDAKVTKRALNIVDSDKSIAMLCLNDDVKKDQTKVDKTLSKWLQKRWPDSASWES